MAKKRKAIFEVIKYEGPDDVLIWKHEAEDFNSLSRVVVDERQEAIFFREGQVMDTLPPGTHPLDTKNIPIIRKVIGLATGGVSPFHCQIYYINKSVSMGLEWGTNSPIEMMDAQYGIPIKVKSYGDFSLSISNGKKFLMKLTGAGKNFTQEDIKRYFKEIIEAHIRDCIANTMISNRIGAMEFNTKLLTVSADIKDMLGRVFAEYGLELNHFVVSSLKAEGLEEVAAAIKNVAVQTIEEEGKAKIDNIKLVAEVHRIQATGEAQNSVLFNQGMVEAKVNQEKGITEVQKRGFSVAETLAANQGPNVTVAGGVGGTMPGCGYGTVVGNGHSPAGMASEIVKTVMGTAASPEEAARASRKAKLMELKDWFECGVITEEEYREKRKEILESL